MPHQFYLMKEHETLYADYLLVMQEGKQSPLIVDDDFLWYIKDTLDWIPTINPASISQPNGYGLNFYGPTIVNFTGAKTAKEVFSLWKQLFLVAPNIIRIRGPVSIIEDDLEKKDEPTVIFPILTYEKSSLISILTKLEGFTEQVKTNLYYILHFGV